VAVLVEFAISHHTRSFDKFLVHIKAEEALRDCHRLRSETKFKREARYGNAWAFLQMLIVFSFVFRSNKIFLVMRVTGVIYVAYFISFLVFSVSKTPDVF
jgi:hypothetical protein